ILWNPSRPEMDQTTSRNSVLALFDTSESMSVIEEGSTTRLDRALEVFKSKFAPHNPEGPRYKIYGFDHECYYGGSSDSLRRWGQRTNMHSAFALLDRYEIMEAGDNLPDHKKAAWSPGNPVLQQPAAKSNVVGAVIFTDGQGDDKNENAYLPLHNKDMKLAIIGVGSKDPQSDVAIKSIKAPSQVTIDTAFTVQVVLTARNLRQDPVTLELFKGDYVVAVKQLSAQALARDVTAEFEVAADKLGRHTLSARARTEQEEVNLANNVRSTMIHVVENSRLRVLLYSQIANFDFGKVRQALAGDEKIQLDLGLDAITTAALSNKARTTCGHVKLPADRAGFYEYDVIILGPCAVDSLTDVQIDGLYSFVAERGGGLILLPGKAEYGPAAWRNEKIRTLIPVFFGSDSIRPEDFEVASHARTATGRVRRSSGRMEITAEGLASKLISPEDLEDHDELTSPYYRFVEKKPAATAVATVRDTPVVSVHRVGRGTVCLLNVSKLFSWYRQDLDGGLLHKFMSGLTAYVGRVTSLEAAVELFAERSGDRTDKVRFDAYVTNRGFAPAAGANVLLSFAEKVLQMDQIGQGHYVAEVEGVTDEAIVATAQAELDGVFLGERTIAVNLPPARSEMDNVELDRRFLKALAKRLDGRYLDAADVDDDLARMFEATRRISSVNRMASVWPRWWLLLALCLLLSINWFVRRAIGLV
ncbi:MAG: hypothetical protein ACYSTZ_06435, partial [Planctomycetota bacterium]